ncbi:neuropeptide Y receptor [Biomphalaria glabrata]|nr:neuropeptide Y receptor-like [Biomphalaria glabrata]
MSDNVTLSSEEEELTRTEIPFIVLYVLMCVIAVLGNSLTVYVVLSRRRMRNVTNYFIASLAVSDVLMALICIPFTFVANIILNWWPFGSIMCSVVTYLQAAIVFQNAYTLLAMSMERYIAIMHPFMRRLGKRRCLQLVALCWVLAFLTPIPTAITSRLAPPENYTDPDKPVCLEDWESKQKQFTYSLTIMILQYFVPLAVLIYTYAQIVRVIWLKDMPTPAELIQQNGKEDDRINRHHREPDPRKKVSPWFLVL